MTKILKVGLRLGALFGLIFVAGLFVACPIFHGVPAPLWLWFIIIPLLAMLAIAGIALLYFAVGGFDE
jgi:hypothetical protein